MRIILALAVLAALAWGLLAVSPYSILINSSVARLGHDAAATLTCRYFSGRAVFDTQFWFAPSDLFGRSHCAKVLRN